VSDEDSVLPGHFIQDLDGNWRPVHVSGEVCTELLRLAGRVKELEAALEGTAQIGCRGHQLRRDHQRKIVAAALEARSWNVSATARDLGISRVGLHKRMRALNLSRSGNAAQEQ
jgi:transcriptional regulator of acetoin/glycerol metabolism